MAAVYLFTDYGAADPYAGQVKAALLRYAPSTAAVDLLHSSPDFNVKAGAHLLAALAGFVPEGSVVLAVIDPGVGGPRQPVAVNARGMWFVGPDNGLLSVAAARAASYSAHTITWRPSRLSDSFHGRDLFAPVAAFIASGRAEDARLGEPRRLEVELDAVDLTEIIYVDHYGNAMTGLRARSISRSDRLRIGGHTLSHARIFSEAPPGVAFWHVNSMGLVEIAVNSAHAADMLGLTIGQRVELQRIA